MYDPDEIENEAIKMLAIGSCIFICLVVTIAFFCNAMAADKVLLERKYVIVEFLDIDPPKHVYADIYDYDRKVKLEHVYVSKHFNSWRTLVPNTNFKAWREKYQYTTSSLSKKFGRENRSWIEYHRITPQ